MKRNPIVLLVSVLLFWSCSTEESEIRIEEKPCGLESQIPVATIFERLDVNRPYRFISAYHIPTEVTISDTTSCIFTFNRFLDYENDGFYFLGLNDSTKKRLFGAQIREPVWSPDGNWLLWFNNENIFKMPYRFDSLDYSQVSNLTRDSAILVDPKWSPEQQQILFQSVAAPEISDFAELGLYIMNEDGTGHERIYEVVDDALWLSEAEILLQQGRSLSVINLFTGQERSFFQFPADFDAIRNMTISPTGNDIFFIARSGSDENVALYQLSRNNLEVTKILGLPTTDFAILEEGVLIVIYIEDRITSLAKYDLRSDDFQTLYSYSIL